MNVWTCGSTGGRGEAVRLGVEAVVDDEIDEVTLGEGEQTKDAEVVSGIVLVVV